jgi:ribosome-binding protein aMBF1 (putative translation factor)
MRIGKSGAVTCDFCGKVVVGDADCIRRDRNEMHFCRGACMDEYLYEHHMRDTIEQKVEPRVREEFNTIHKQVCPACKYRLQKLL